MARREGAPPPRARKPRTEALSAGDNTGAAFSEVNMQEAVATQPTKRPPGRPPGGRPFVARHSIRLNAAQQEALMTIAGQRGQSVHSLLLEAVDAFIRSARPLGLS